MRQPTLEQIAVGAGVSPMTVSRALRGVGRVSAATRERVREAAKAAGYGQQSQGVFAPPAHRGRTDHRLRLLLPVLTPAMNESRAELSQELLRGLRARLELNDGELHLATCQSLDEIMAVWQASRAQGLVLRTQVPDAWVRVLCRRGPVVNAVAQDFHLGVDSIYTNEMRAAAMVFDHLVRLGHEQIAWFGWFDTHMPDSLARSLFDEATVVDRRTASVHASRYAAWAYLASCQPDRDRQPLLLLERDWDREDLLAGVERGLGQLLSLSPRPTAIVVPSDPMGEALLAALVRQGLKVPGEISVICYGGTSITRQTTPPLTAVKLPMFTIGKAVPELIERRLADPEAVAVSLQFEAELVSGGTVGPASGG
jgi:LacI family transcriptional regulator